MDTLNNTGNNVSYQFIESTYDLGIQSPLEQFDIKSLLSFYAPILGDIHLSLTNIGLYLTIAAFIVLTVNLLANNYNKVVYNS